MKIQDCRKFQGLLFPCVIMLGIVLGHGLAWGLGEGLLVSGELLEQAGLETDWQVNLPMKSAEVITRMYAFGEYAYALTNRNYIYCVDIANKGVRFGTQVALRGLPISEPCHYEGQLWFMVGNELLTLDPKSGTVAKRKRLESVGRSVICGVVRNKDYLYVPGSDKRLHAIMVDGLWQSFMVASDDDSQVSCVVADDEFVILATESGNISRIGSTEPKRRWQYQVIGKVTAPMVRDGGWVYISSRNSKLYKLDVNRGHAGWEESFHAGTGLKKGVVAGEKVVYQPAEEKGLYAIDKETGKEVWNVERGADILAEIDGKAYVYAYPGVLVVMENATGKKLYSLNIAGVEKYVVNPKDGAIYLAEAKGRIVRIEPKRKKGIVSSGN